MCLNKIYQKIRRGGWISPIPLSDWFEENWEDTKF